MESVLLVEHVIVAFVVVWLVRKVCSLGLGGTSHLPPCCGARVFRMLLLTGCAAGVRDAVVVGAIRGLSAVPGVKGRIAAENEKVVKKIGAMVKNRELDELARERGLMFRRIPSDGVAAEQLLPAMQAMRSTAIEKAYAAGKARPLPLPWSHLVSG